MNKYQAMYSFFDSFGLDVYEENSVPTTDPLPAFPYLTYDASASCEGAEIQINFSIWYRDTSAEAISLKAQAISQAIGWSYQVDCDEGSIIIRRGDSFIQDMNDDNDPLVKRKVFTIYAKYMTIY